MHHALLSLTTFASLLQSIRSVSCCLSALAMSFFRFRFSCAIFCRCPFTFHLRCECCCHNVFCLLLLLKTTFYRWLLLYCHLPMLKHTHSWVFISICGNSSSISHFKCGTANKCETQRTWHFWSSFFLVAQLVITLCAHVVRYTNSDGCECSCCCFVDQNAKTTTNWLCIRLYSPI